jgi:putative ABC transport system ATP-binding protein
MYARSVIVAEQLYQPDGSNKNSGAKDVPPHLIKLEQVNKIYATPAGEFIAVNDINLSISKGDFAAVAGRSGSGKTTLLNMISGIARPSSGKIYVDDIPVHNLKEGQLAQWRGRTVGIVFQFFQLLPTLSCLENVMLPMDFCSMYVPKESEERAMHLLEQVAMAKHAHKLPSEISGGEQQRVAIARAMANDPSLIVADEPTGNLDTKTADAIFHVFEGLIDQGKTIVLVTHDPELANRANRVLNIEDGQITADTISNRLTPRTSGVQA